MAALGLVAGLLATIASTTPPAAAGAQPPSEVRRVAAAPADMDRPAALDTSTTTVAGDFEPTVIAEEDPDDIAELLDEFLPDLPDPETFTFVVHSIHDGVERHTDATAFAPNLIDVTGDGIADVSVRLTAVPDIPAALAPLLELLASETGVSIDVDLSGYYALLANPGLTALFDRLLGPLGFLFGISPEVRKVLSKVRAFLEMAEESDALRSVTGELKAIPLNGGAALVIDKLNPAQALPALVEAVVTLDPDEGDTVRAGYDGRETAAPAKFVGVVAEGSESIDISVDVAGADESLTMLGGFLDVKPGEGSTDTDATLDYSPVPHEMRFQIAETDGEDSGSLRIDTFHDSGEDALPDVNGTVEADIEGEEQSDVTLDLAVVGMPTTLGVTQANNPGKFKDDEGEDTTTSELHYRASAPVPEIDVAARIVEPEKDDAVHARLLDTTAPVIDLVQDGDTFEIHTPEGGDIGRTDASFSQNGAGRLLDLPPRDPSLPEEVHIDDTLPALEAAGLVSLNGLSDTTIDWQEEVEGTRRFKVTLTHRASPLHIEVQQAHRSLTADLDELPSEVKNVEVTFSKEAPEVPEGESVPEGPHDVDGDGLFDEMTAHVIYEANDTIASITATADQDAVAADPDTGQEAQEDLFGEVTLLGVPARMDIGFNGWTKPEPDSSQVTCDDTAPDADAPTGARDRYCVTYDASGELDQATIDFTALQSGEGENGQPTSALGAAGKLFVQLKGMPGGTTTADVTVTEDEKVLDFDSDGRIEEATFSQEAVKGGWLKLHGDPDGDTGHRKTTDLAARVVDIPTSVDATVADGSIEATTAGGEPGVGRFLFREADRPGGFRSTDGLEFIDRESDYRVTARISGLRSVSFDKTAQLYDTEFDPIPDATGEPVRSCSAEDFAEYQAEACDETTTVDIHTDNGGPMYVNVSQQDATKDEATEETVWSPRKDIVLDATDLPRHGSFTLRLSKRNGALRKDESTCRIEDDPIPHEVCDKTWQPGTEPVFAWWDGHGDDGGRIEVDTTDRRAEDDKSKTLSVTLDPLPAKLHTCLDSDGGHCWTPKRWYNSGSYFFDSTTRTAVRVTYKDFKDANWTVKVGVSLKALAFAHHSKDDGLGPEDKRLAIDTDGYEVYALDGTNAVDVRGALNLNLPRTRNIPAFYAQNFYSYVDIDIFDDDPVEFENKSGAINCPIDHYDGNPHWMTVGLIDVKWGINATLKTFYEADIPPFLTRDPEHGVWKNKLYATGLSAAVIEHLQCDPDGDSTVYTYNFPNAS